VLRVVGKEKEMWAFCFSCYGKESANSSHLFFCYSWWIVNDQFQLNGLIPGGLEVAAI
jgi:hypothetical protein